MSRAWIFAVIVLALTACAEPRPASVLIIMIDTLRADHLGSYGYERETSPNIDRLASEGVRFERAYSVAPWTNPTIASIFTGQYPRAVLQPTKHKEAIRISLPDEVETLAERVESAGIRTIGLVDHPGISRGRGYAQGFQEYVYLGKEGGFGAWEDADSDFIRDRVRSTLAGLEHDRFLLYLHLIYPHRPYTPPPPFQGSFGPEAPGKRYGRASKAVAKKMSNAYDAEILRADHLVGEIIEDMQDLGLLESTWVVLLSDHGEGFGEHGRLEHGNSFFDELLRVPLIVLPPQRARRPQVVTEPVSTIDVFPTLLDILGLPVPETASGDSLLRFVEGTPGRPRLLISSSSSSGDVQGGSIRRGRWKLIDHPVQEANPLLFDSDADPEEKDNLAGTGVAEEPGLRQALQDHFELVDAARAALPTGAPAEVDAESLERLKALGYVD